MSNDWSRQTLGSLIDIKHGFAFKSKFFSETPTLFQLTTPGNFAIGGGFKLGKEKFYSGSVSDDYVLKPGDLLVTMTDLSKAADTLGYAAVVPETKGITWLHNQRVGLISIKPGAPVSLNFLHYLMRSPDYRNWVISTATGSTVKHTSPSRICEFDFLLPTIDYQTWIAEILGALDDCITLLHQTNSTLEAIAQTLFKSWFLDFDPVREKQKRKKPKGIDEETAALFPDSFEQSELGEIPKGWMTESLGDLVVPKRGKTITKKKCIAGDVPVVAGGLDPAYFHNQSNVTSPVITISASGANAGFVRLYQQDIWASDCSYISNEQSKVVFYWYLLLKNAQEKIYFMQQGAVQPHISPSDLMRLKVASPNNMKIVTNFNSTVSTLFERIKVANLEIQILSNIRDTLLPRLISGHLRLSDIEEINNQTKVDA
jgi:type I restriction enzyme S subunit